MQQWFFEGIQGGNSQWELLSCPSCPPRLGRLQQCQEGRQRLGTQTDTSAGIWPFHFGLLAAWSGLQAKVSIKEVNKLLQTEWEPAQSDHKWEWMGSAARAEMGVKLWGRTYGQGSPPEKCWHSPQDLAREAQSIINAILSCLFNEKAKITICFCK